LFFLFGEHFLTPYLSVAIRIIEMNLFKKIICSSLTTGPRFVLPRRTHDVVTGYILYTKAKALTRFSATRDHLEARRATQPIEGEFSPKSAIHFSRSGPHTPSIASQSNKRPAISRSEFVIVPVGLSNKTTCDRMSSGHCQQNSIGVHAESSPKITPPTPWLDASTIPIKSGHPHVSSRHQVGSHVDSQRSVRHLSIALRAFKLRWK
jgi:hypothetical protein